ncbi:heavy-metal-associated domain-containing protein [Arthrobacter sp. UYCu723]
MRYNCRTELPLTAPNTSGCSCCSTGARTHPASLVEGFEYSLEGLACAHCVQTVEKAATLVDGVESATVELVAGGTSRLTVAGTASVEAVRDAVTFAGYSVAASR